MIVETEKNRLVFDNDIVLKPMKSERVLVLAYKLNTYDVIPLAWIHEKILRSCYLAACSNEVQI